MRLKTLFITNVFKGKIAKASFVKAPGQRNTKAENKQIKQGKVPEQWNKNPHKKRQKDTHARSTKKNDESHYRYKSHARGQKSSTHRSAKASYSSYSTCSDGHVEG
ncbi:MAG: hypothetical protein AAF620_17140 [Bacteroidota bacterium]